MTTNFRGVAAMVMVLAGPAAFAGVDAPGPITLGKVEYRVEHEQDGPEAPLKATVKAIDARSDTVLWRVMLYEGTSRDGWMKGVKNPRVVGLARFAEGLVASTDDGATFFIDPTARKSSLVRDMRHQPGDCSVHHRPKVGLVVPIHYGLGTLRRPSAEGDGSSSGFDRPIEGGCCVMPEKAAILSYCAECPAADR